METKFPTSKAAALLRALAEGRHVHTRPRGHLEREFGVASANRYWTIFEELRTANIAATTATSKTTKPFLMIPLLGEMRSYSSPS